MATGYDYKKEKFIFDGVDVGVAEDLAAFLIMRGACTVRPEEMIPLLPEIYERFPNTILCVSEFQGVNKPYKITFPDRVEEMDYWSCDAARQTNSWSVAVDTITSAWGSMAYDAELLSMIDKADIPDALRAFLRLRVVNGERIDHGTAKKGFPADTSKGSPVWYIAGLQHAWHDEHIYASVVDGAVKTDSSSYSIGD